MNFRKRFFRIFSCPTGFYHPLAGSLEGPEGGEIISHRDTEGTEFFIPLCSLCLERVHERVRNNLSQRHREH
jgi:hypothetical protein